MSTYVIGTPARDDNFYGRKEELQAILSHQNWTWVCGQRRIGKTSLLYRIEQEALQSGWLPLFFDLATVRAGNATGRVLFNKFYRTHRRRSFESRGIRLEDFDDLEPAECFRELVEILIEKEGTNILFLWDEVERLIDVEEHDSGFLESLRAQMLGLKRFRFVIAGTQLLSGLFDLQTHCSPFLAIFHWRPLSGLDNTEARNLLLCQQIGGLSYQFPEEILEEAVKWSGGHPLVLQHLGSMLFEHVRHEGRQKINREILAQSIKHIEADPNLRKIVEDDYAKLTRLQQSLLTKVSQSDTELSLDDIDTLKDYPRTDIEDAANILSRYGYVSTNGHIRLRFMFYPNLLPPEVRDSVADQNKVNRIRRNIFIVYSHQDAQYLSTLKTFLASFARSGEIEYWDDQTFERRANWQEELEKTLQRARAVLLVISPAFLRSKFITEVELPDVLSETIADCCQLLAFHLRPSNIGELVYPKSGQPVSLSDFHDLNSPDGFETLDKAQKEAVSVNIVMRLFGKVPEDTSILFAEPSPPFDVFLCHNSEDKPEVKGIGNRLKEHGITPWLDEEQLRPGMPWQRALEEQIETIKSAAVFVGKNGKGPWQGMEIEALLREFVKRKCPVIPVLLPACPDAPELPVFLKGMTWVDFRKREPDPFKRLIWGITGKRVDED